MDTKSYKTLSANGKDIEKKWLVIDFEGKILGRAASEVARLLRGKHKTHFTPHIDCGDNVIVINADKVVFTGAKLDQKSYLRHTGYPGGQREVTARNLLSEKSTILVEKAVKGMLPKTKLGKAIIKNLRVYGGAEHPHSAQNPEEYKI
ncbi:MAG: 50S ribosomal protein L13 [Bacteroidia bacterium]